MALNITGKHLTIAGMGGLLGAAYMSLSPQLNTALKAIMATSSVTLLAGLYLNSRAKPVETLTDTKVKEVAITNKGETTIEPILLPQITIGEHTITLQQQGETFADCGFAIEGEPYAFSGADLLTGNCTMVDQILSGFGFVAPPKPTLEEVFLRLQDKPTMTRFAENFGKDYSQAYVFITSDAQRVVFEFFHPEACSNALASLSPEDQQRLAEDLTAILDNAGRIGKPRPFLKQDGGGRIIFFDQELEQTPDEYLSPFDRQRKDVQELKPEYHSEPRKQPAWDQRQSPLEHQDERAYYTRPTDTQ